MSVENYHFLIDYPKYASDEHIKEVAADSLTSYLEFYDYENIQYLSTIVVRPNGEVIPTYQDKSEAKEYYDSFAKIPKEKRWQEIIRRSWLMTGEQLVGDVPEHSSTTDIRKAILQAPDHMKKKLDRVQDILMDLSEESVLTGEEAWDLRSEIYQLNMSGSSKALQLYLNNLVSVAGLDEQEKEIVRPFLCPTNPRNDVRCMDLREDKKIAGRGRETAVLAAIIRT